MHKNTKIPYSKPITQNLYINMLHKKAFPSWDKTKEWSLMNRKSNVWTLHQTKS
jgi:hypothetical protein